MNLGHQSETRVIQVGSSVRTPLTANGAFACLAQLPQYARKSSNLEVFFRCKSLFDGLTKVSTAM